MLPLATLRVAGHPVSLGGAALLGVGVGYVAGMFGVGGGFLLTPLLSVVFRIPLEIAVGTGLCQMVGTSVTALLRHQRVRQGEVRFDLVMLAGCLVGVDGGARVLTALARAGSVRVGGHPVAAVRLTVEVGYVVLLLAAAAVFWREGAGPYEALDYVRVAPLARLRLPPFVDLPAVPLRRVSATAIAYTGLALGFMSGLLGIGGGVALMPVLIYGFGFPIRQAAGTGIVALVATAAVGTVEHALRGHVHLGLAMVLLVGATVSAQLGALATHRLPARTLRRAFALLLLGTVGAIAWDLGRHLG
ncbi:MAG TPA: sulfite exporter TauE/SafE family protein [Candidatus Binatia bacterium]|nr:sulfite exporter TauE/SafE family protein [Candidatus Binatia bacterium]